MVNLTALSIIFLEYSNFNTSVAVIAQNTILQNLEVLIAHISYLLYSYAGFLPPSVEKNDPRQGVSRFKVYFGKFK